MSRMPRIIIPLIVVVGACSDAPSATSVRAARPSEPAYDKGGQSAAQGIDDVIAALNAAWAAKNAAAYAAPLAEDAVIITPVGTILSGRAAFQARHVILFAGPLKASTQILTVQRVQLLTGTIAIVDGQAVLTGFAAIPPGQPATEPGVARSLVRWVLEKRGGDWEIVAQQSTGIPPTP
jgi:uncharacterized protein (TIGR02246 family)